MSKPQAVEKINLIRSPRPYVEVEEECVNLMSACNLAAAAPLSMEAVADGRASAIELNLPAATRAAAALRTTTSRLGERSPASRSMMIWALTRASPPLSSSMGDRLSPNVPA